MVDRNDDIVDLRSDTVTRPTAAMRQAMYDAEVGDDGFGDDPTVNRLEATFAERLGKEAAMFVPSGTMGNQIALRLLGRPGTAVITGRTQHVVLFEAGGAGMNGSAQFQLVDDDDGILDLAAARLAIAGADHHWLAASAICIEDTHMFAGGRCWPLEQIAAVAGLGLPVHLDGARLFHAEVATGVSVADRARLATTVMCCLSKGLGAPVGSLLAGPADLLAEARAERKRLGGSIRQAGILAAAGLVALDEMVARLADDHARARRLAQAVANRWPGVIDPSRVETNIVVFPHPDPDGLARHLEADRVLMATVAPGLVRLVTHKDVDDDRLERACKALAAAPDPE